MVRIREVNPVRNSSGALNPVRDLSLNGINPALRGGTPYGAEPGIILKSNPAAKQRGIISNGVKKEIFPSLLNLFFFPLDSKVCEYEYKVLSSHFYRCLGQKNH